MREISVTNILASIFALIVWMTWAHFILYGLTFELKIGDIFFFIYRGGLITLNWFFPSIEERGNEYYDGGT